MTDAHLVAHQFNGQRLTVAREVRGLTKTALAEKVAKTPSAVSQFESGRLRPDAQTVRQIALALGFPLDYFAKPGTGLVVPLDDCHFRSLRSANQRDRRRLLARASLVCDVVDLLERYVELPEDRISSIGTTAKGTTGIEAAAVAVREAWGLGLGPIPSVMNLVEANGAVVILVGSSGEAVDAFSFWHRHRPVMVLVDKNAPSRLRFDVAHELGHLVLHADTTPASVEREREANRFGSAFLLPADSFGQEAPRWLNWDLLLALKGRWGASLAALLKRSYDLGVLSEASYRRGFQRLNSSGQRHAEPEEPPPEPPVVLQRALALVARERPLSELSVELGFPVDGVFSGTLAAYDDL